MRLLRRLSAILLAALCGVLGAVDPPTAEQVAEYRRDGTLAARIEAVKALGHHRVPADRIAAAVQRLQRQMLRNQGLSEVEVDSRMAPPPAWRGLPTKGAPKILVMLLDFPDYTAQVSKAEIEARIFGDGVPDEYPVESLRNYYKRSSYDQLQLSGSVLGYYRYPTNKASIPVTTNQRTTREGIIKELFQHFDAQGHDFSQYDNDGDGEIDYFVVIYTGPNNGWGNFWWAYQTSYGDRTFKVDGKGLSTYVWQYLDQSQSNSGGNPTRFRCRTLVHETGHALGLPDYYDYDDAAGPRGGVGGLDMMAANKGDHNAFSKWLLDWITPTPVTTARAGVALRPKSEHGDALAVMPTLPAGGSAFGEYFLVENRQRTLNDADTSWGLAGLMIWHVDATLDASQSDFVYDNSYSAHKLLRLMEADGLEQIEQGGTGHQADLYTAGKEFGPMTTPNSKAYSGADTNVGIKNISEPTPSITLDVTFDAPPLGITAIAPTTGPVGTVVTLTGKGFTGATRVAFNGTTATYTVVSDTRVTATVPSGATTGQVSITTPGGTASGPTFQVGTGPVITSFSPARGVAGTLVTVTGTGFTGATSVLLNGVTGSCAGATSDTQASFYVRPTQSTGRITVTTSLGTATSPLDFIVDPHPAPTITGFSPAAGEVGTQVTITGSAIYTTDCTVRFNGTSAAANFYCSGTQVIATVPSGATSGPITIVSPRGTATSASSFVIGTAPTLTSFAPASGAPGTLVTLTGTGFAGVTAVTFNGVSATFSALSATQLTATVPAGATTGTLQVTASGGTATSSSAFTVLPAAPTLTSFAPASGAPGTLVTLTGTGFTGVTAVTFNGVSATFSTLSATQVTATVPAGATTGFIQVTATGGVVTSAASFTVETVPVLSITAFAPTSGAVGTIVTLTGTGFSGVTSVTFGGVSAGFDVLNDTTIRATVPSGAVTGLIRLSKATQMADSLALFQVGISPVVTSLERSTGSPGVVFRVFGSELNSTVSVTMGGTEAVFSVLSGTQLSVTVPPGAKTGAVVVTTLFGVGVGPVFTVGLSPVISGFSPNSGSAGTVVTVNGQNLGTVQRVLINGVASACQPGGSDSSISFILRPAHASGLIRVETLYGSAATVVPVSIQAKAPMLVGFTPSQGEVGQEISLQGEGLDPEDCVVHFSGASAAPHGMDCQGRLLLVRVPAGARTGRIMISSPRGAVTSLDSFVVGTLTQISEVYPASGPVGATVTLRGSGLATASAVRFSGAAATFQVISDSQVVATVPLGATTGPIEVVTPAGSVFSSSSFTVLPAAPTLVSFLPTSGSPGAWITLTGTGLAGTSSVSFNGMAAEFNGVTETQVLAKVPSGATTGLIRLTTPGGVAVSPVDFGVLSSGPVLAAFTPASGDPGTVVTLLGRGFATARAIRFNGVLATFTVLTDHEATTTVPEGATTGPITVETPQGIAQSGTAFVVPPRVMLTGTFTGCVVGFQKTFVATVVGSADTSVAWSSQPAGLITPDGRFTAPATPGPVTLTATAVADSSRRASLTFAVRGRNLAGNAWVDVADLAVLAKFHGSSVPDGSVPAAVCDLNGDGVVDDADVALFFLGF